MGWQFTDDVDSYARRTTDLLAASPVENTVALTVTASVQAGVRWSREPMLFGWYALDGPVTGAVSMTPPYELLLASVPEPALLPLVDALHERDVVLPGVNGETSVAQSFAAAWSARRGLRADTRRRERLYRLHSLLPAPADGRPRAATAADIGLVVEWFTRFQVEAGVQTVDVADAVRDRVDRGLLWLWEDGGRVVSMAGRNGSAAGVARIGPVYTPPEHRRCGFGAAVTAAWSSDALARDARNVVLFTDLANPTSNAIYQSIGYRPLRDHEVLAFHQA